MAGGRSMSLGNFPIPPFARYCGKGQRDGQRVGGGGGGLRTRERRVNLRVAYGAQNSVYTMATRIPSDAIPQPSLSLLSRHMLCEIGKK